MTARVLMLLKSRASLTCSEVVSFLVGLRIYQHPECREGSKEYIQSFVTDPCLVKPGKKDWEEKS